MNYNSFEKIILNLQAARERSRQMYKLGVDLMTYEENYEHAIDELFRVVFNPEQLGWIDWYLYERPSLSGKGKLNKAWKKVGRKKVEICHTIESLWETVSEYDKQADSDDNIAGWSKKEVGDFINRK